MATEVGRQAATDFHDALHSYLTIKRMTGNSADHPNLHQSRLLLLPLLQVVAIKLEDRPDLHIAHQIYLTAKALRELIEEPAISDSSRRIIER